MWTRASLWHGSSLWQDGWRQLSSFSFAQLCGLGSISVPRTGLQSELWKSGKEEESSCLKTPCYYWSSTTGGSLDGLGGAQMNVYFSS